MLAIGTDVLDNIHVSHKDRCRIGAAAAYQVLASRQGCGDAAGTLRGRRARAGRAGSHLCSKCLFNNSTAYCTLVRGSGNCHSSLLEQTLIKKNKGSFQLLRQERHRN